MKRLLLGSVLTVAAVLLAACGPSEEETAAKAGAEACEIYHDALIDDPQAIASYAALPEIKDMLSDLDTPTRRAFAGLITAADANPYMPGADPTIVDDAAAEVRSVCLAEHDVEIPS